MTTYFRPLEVSAADLLVSDRLTYPDAAPYRAVEQRIEQLRDVASTTWTPRRMVSAGYDPGTFEYRREARRRTALAAELVALRRLGRERAA